MDSRTSVFDVKTIRQELILLSLNEIMNSLDNAGYDATNQLVGYILTNDPTYITSHEGARDKIQQFDRTEILTAILNSYRGK
jgi:uncharacterized protein (UPF0297 family)